MVTRAWLTAALPAPLRSYEHWWDRELLLSTNHQRHQRGQTEKRVTKRWALSAFGLASVNFWES